MNPAPVLSDALLTCEEVQSESLICEVCKHFQAWGLDIDETYPDSLRADEYTRYETERKEHERATGHTIPSSY